MLKEEVIKEWNNLKEKITNPNLSKLLVKRLKISNEQVLLVVDNQDNRHLAQTIRDLSSDLRTFCVADWGIFEEIN